MHIFLMLLLLTSIYVFSVFIRSDFSRWWGLSFAIWWGGLFSVSMFDPYGVYAVSLDGYLILFCFVLVFLLGYLLVDIVMPSNRGAAIRRVDGVLLLVRDFERLSGNRWARLIVLMVLFSTLYYFVKYLSVVIGGAVDLRSVRYEIGGVFESGIEVFLFDYVIGGSINFFKFIVAFGLVFSRKKIFIWWASFIICCLYMAFGLGRYIVVEIGIFVLYLLLIANSFGYRTDFSLKRPGFLLFGGFLYVISVLATMLRVTDVSLSLNAISNANSILLEHSVVYFIGSFRAFDYAYHNFSGWFDFGNGLMTLGGVDEVLSIIGKGVGLNTIPYSNYWGEIISVPISIGDGISFNALYTSVFNFYFDFGFIGVVVFGFAFGGLCALSVFLYQRRVNLSLAFASGLLFNFAIMSCLAWRLAKGPAVIVLVAALVIGLRKRADCV